MVNIPYLVVIDDHMYTMVSITCTHVGTATSGNSCTVGITPLDLVTVFQELVVHKLNSRTEYWSLVLNKYDISPILITKHHMS